MVIVSWEEERGLGLNCYIATLTAGHHGGEGGQRSSQDLQGKGALLLPDRFCIGEFRYQRGSRGPLSERFSI